MQCLFCVLNVALLCCWFLPYWQICIHVVAGFYPMSKSGLVCCWLLMLARHRITPALIQPANLFTQTLACIRYDFDATSRGRSHQNWPPQATLVPNTQIARWEECMGGLKRGRYGSIVVITLRRLCIQFPEETVWGFACSLWVCMVPSGYSTFILESKHSR